MPRQAVTTRRSSGCCACRTVLARDLGLKPSAATIESIRLARERRLAGQQTTAAGNVTANTDATTPDAVQRYAPPDRWYG